MIAILFWVRLASRPSFMFDGIHWTSIDPKYFGPLTSVEERFGLLSGEKRRELNYLWL